MIEHTAKHDLSTQHGFVEFCKAQAKATIKNLESEVANAEEGVNQIGFLSRKLHPYKARSAAAIVYEKESRLRVTKEIASILEQSSEVYFSEAEGNWHLTAIGPRRQLRMGYQEGRLYAINSGFEIYEIRHSAMGTRNRNEVYPRFFSLQYTSREVLRKQPSAPSTDSK